jgi:uncharacterized lipoprotein
MQRLGRWFPLLAVLAFAGCSHDAAVQCESPERYASSQSVPPVRVPDDLSVPDETDALRIPDPFPPASLPSDQPCLETPPDFGEGGLGAR